MKKGWLIAIVLLLQACSLRQFEHHDSVNRIHVVKITPHYRHYRAYFERTSLQPVTKHQKYLFVYNPKTKGLGVILRKNNTYLLHRFVPKPYRPLKLTAKTLSYRLLKKELARLGYRPVTPESYGFATKLGLRKYKGLKTLMIEVKDYRPLLRRYKKALRTYRYGYVSNISTRPPKHLISPSIKRFAAKADTLAKKRNIEKIAKKAGITLSLVSKTKIKKQTESKRKTPRETKTLHSPQTTPKETPSPSQDTHTQPKPLETTPDMPEEKTPSGKSFDYYLNFAPSNELKRYLKRSESISKLSSSQYLQLKKRLRRLEEEKLLREGSLESLLEAYKHNKNPRFKARILELMKQKQLEKQH